jgi:hypothetical protein
MPPIIEKTVREGRVIMKRAKLIFLKQILTSFLSLLIFLSFAYAQVNVSISDILSNPEKYDGKYVQVTGKCANIHYKVSKKGNSYTVFELVDSGGSIKVFSFNHIGISEGDRVMVNGIYQRVKRVGPYTFYNEIDASGGEIKKIK